MTNTQYHVLHWQIMSVQAMYDLGDIVVPSFISLVHPDDFERALQSLDPSRRMSDEARSRWISHYQQHLKHATKTETETETDADTQVDEIDVPARSYDRER